MQIDLSFDASAAAAPSGFEPAIQDAANILDNLITNDITVTINVGWGEIGGETLSSGDLAEGAPLAGAFITPAEYISLLSAYGDATAQAEIAALPANAAAQLPGEIYLAPAQEQALGLLSASDILAGEVGFASADYTFDPNNQAVPGEYSIIGAALHELTHALGRTLPDVGLELTAYTSPGTLAAATDASGYFSLDGGNTKLQTFDPTGDDTSDWAGTTATNGDAFALEAAPGVAATITTVDQQMLSALGFDIGAQSTQSGFQLTDQTVGATSTVAGTAYSGPVSGLQTQLILSSDPDNLAIVSHTPSAFICTGSGNDAIDVSQAGGNNVLDGGTGSNFLTGGSGNDTFFVDDRSPASAIWSTVEGFHSGDAVTVWGLTPQDFTLNWVDGAGAPGYTGLTLGATAAGQSDANLTLVGYTSADLSNGRLTVAFGTTPNEPNLPGSPYMQITAA